MLSPQERQIVEFGKKNNQNKEQIIQALQTFRESGGTTTPQPMERFGRTRRILGTIFGGEKIGEAIGTVIAKRTVPEEQKEFVEPAPPAREVVADIAGTALTTAGFGGLGAVGRFGSRILKMFGLGAGLAGTEALKEGADVIEAVKPALAGGAIGGALPIGGAGLRALGTQIELLPARFINSALGRKKSQVLQDIKKDKVDDFAKFVLESKQPVKSANKHLDESIDGVIILSKKIDSALASAIRKTGDKTTIGIDNFLDEIVTLPEATGALLNRGDVKNIIVRLAPQTKQLLSKQSLNLQEANRLRQLLDTTLGDRAFLGAQLSSDKAILKQFTNTLRDRVKSKAPEGTRELFAELTNEIRFRDGLLDRVAQKAGNQVLSFGDFIGGGLGGIFGGGLGGALAGVATRRAIESVPFKLSAAKITEALTKAAPTIEAMTPAQQTTILNLFADIFSEEIEPEK